MSKMSELAIDEMNKERESQYHPPEWNSEEFNERRITKKQNLHDLVRWLEYGKKSGHIAERQPIQQEVYWSDLLKSLLAKTQ